MLNNYLYDFLSHVQLQIYIIRTKLRNIRSSFFKVCLKAVFADGCLGVPLRVRLSIASPRYAVGFSLQSLTWVKGISLSCVDTLAHGTKFIIGISLARPLLSRMNGNSYFTFAVISSIRFVIFLMEYFCRY